MDIWEARATASNGVVVLLVVVPLLAMVAWLDARRLTDLSRTSDGELRSFDRGTWAPIIVLSFPIGPMLYLLDAKGPHRYR